MFVWVDCPHLTNSTFEMRLIVTAAAIVLALANDRSAVAQQAVSKESFSLPLPVKLTPKEEVDVRASLNNYISSRNVQPYRVVITMFNESSATVIGVVITESVSSDTGALSIPDAVAVVRSGLLANSYVMAAFTVGGPPSSTLVPSAIFAPFDGSGGDSSSNLTPLWIALAGVGIALLALLAICPSYSAHVHILFTPCMQTSSICAISRVPHTPPQYSSSSSSAASTSGLPPGRRRACAAPPWSTRSHTASASTLTSRSPAPLSSSQRRASSSSQPHSPFPVPPPPLPLARPGAPTEAPPHPVAPTAQLLRTRTPPRPHSTVRR